MSETSGPAGPTGPTGPTGPADQTWDAHDDALLTDLALMWERLDPVPDGLAAELAAVVEAAVAAEELDDDLILLELTSPSLAGLGVRGQDLVVIEFTCHDAGSAIHVMIRLSAGRIDGWVGPAVPGTAVVHAAGRDLATTVDDDGRFVLTDVPSGAATLRFTLADGRRYLTPAFQV